MHIMRLISFLRSHYFLDIFCILLLLLLGFAANIIIGIFHRENSHNDERTDGRALCDIIAPSDLCCEWANSVRKWDGFSAFNFYFRSCELARHEVRFYDHDCEYI